MPNHLYKEYNQYVLPNIEEQLLIFHISKGLEAPEILTCIYSIELFHYLLLKKAKLTVINY